jgi:flagellar biosynthetic protein FliR
VTDADALLAQLPQWGFAVALLIARAGSACMLIPVVGEAELPGTIRAGFALALVALLLPVVGPQLPPAPASVPAAAALVVAEIATGLWLGWLARLLVQALTMAGQIIASLTGLANVMQPDVAQGPPTSALSRAFGLAAPVALLASGLYALPLAALAGSYGVVPAGTLLPAADSASAAVSAVAGCFGLALRLAAPFLLAGIVWQMALALLARLVPQMQVYFIAMPGQILGGLALLALLAASLLGAWQDHAGASLAALPGL